MLTISRITVMTNLSRHHSLKTSSPKKSAANREIDYSLINPNQKSAGLAINQMIDPAPTNIIIENTDDKIPPQPGNGLIASRKNRIIASLGKRAELVSIIVQAYNRLEKTKICIECILKYTTDIEYELVLVDNGSTDGTLDYFKSVKHPRKKIIRVTKNVGSYVTITMNQLSGRYIAAICNDTYVTKIWLKNLLTCLKSEDAIGMVVPVISNGSNLQGADLTFNSLEEMQEKAAQHNVSDPSLWHERVRLVMQMVIFKQEAMDMAGLTDYGFFHDFADDDLTFRMRRVGYKTVLCKDTFVHHDHIRTNLSEKDIEEFNHSIEAGRQDFKSKFFGIDAWDDVNNYETAMMSLVNPQERDGSKGLEILGVDVLCGTPILELKNKLREARVFDARLSAFSTDPKYWLDLKTICAGKVIVDRIEFMNENFADERFDYVVLGQSINAYQKPLELLQDLLKKLKGDGHLLIKLHNTYDVVSLYKTLGANVRVNDQFNNVYQLSMDELVAQIKNAGFIYKKIAVENWPLGEKEQMILRNTITATGFSNNPDEIFARAVVQNYVIDIARE